MKFRISLIISIIVVVSAMQLNNNLYASGNNPLNSNYHTAWYDDAIFWLWGAGTGDVESEESIRSFLERVKPSAALIGTKHHPGYA